jgi:metallophosphoesterase (TIGR00282 family)
MNLVSKTFRILFYGDVVGEAGRNALAQKFLEIKETYQPDVILANVENATHGFGINKKHFEFLGSLGIQVMTTGNHVWDQKDVFQLLEIHKDRLLRPGNYPSYVDDPCPGSGIAYVSFSPEHPPLCVVNLMGRVFMDPLDCPFQFMDKHLSEIRGKTPYIFLDFHAEATGEKLAMAHYLDGKISAMVGTHTHIQTADESVFPNGMAYLTDVGMCGSHFSVIGMKPMLALMRIRLKRPLKLQVAEELPKIHAVCVDVGLETGRSRNIQRIQVSI